jgi:steroid delta-isomerase-like uncharacterized protein
MWEGGKEPDVIPNENVAAFQAFHEAFNSRDWDKLTAIVAEDCRYIGVDGTEYRGKEGMLSASKEWTKAFSDGQVTEARYYNAGRTIISEFVGRGTHDGPLGDLPPTHREAVFPMVDIFEFDDRSQIIAGRSYTDQLSILRQLRVGLGRSAAEPSSSA